jgi:hypothetical protein
MEEEEITELKNRCKKLAKELGRFTLLSQGSVMAQPPSAWRWTRKVSGKTVSRGLSAEQAELMKEAINNQRKLDEIIDELREASQKLIFAMPRHFFASRPLDCFSSPTTRCPLLATSRQAISAIRGLRPIADKKAVGK